MINSKHSCEAAIATTFRSDTAGNVDGAGVMKSAVAIPSSTTDLFPTGILAVAKSGNATVAALAAEHVLGCEAQHRRRRNRPSLRLRRSYSNNHRNRGNFRLHIYLNVPERNKVYIFIFASSCVWAPAIILFFKRGILSLDPDEVNHNKLVLLIFSRSFE
jgi:hypothetical protein